MKHVFYLLLFLLLIASSLSCSKNNSSQTEPTSSEASFPFTGRIEMETKVLTGTKILINGDACSLLGVRDSDDPATRKQAMEFTTNFFREAGNSIGISNSSNPLRSDDGTFVVWVCASDSDSTCLNIELVRAGLVSIDHENWPDYSFTEGTMSGEDVVADWRGELNAAKESYDPGETPGSDHPTEN